MHERGQTCEAVLLAHSHRFEDVVLRKVLPLRCLRTALVVQHHRCLRTTAPVVPSCCKVCHCLGMRRAPGVRREGLRATTVSSDYRATSPFSKACNLSSM